MVAYLTDAEHWTVSEIEREKAWHIFTVLLSLGRPAHPAELAARCGLFHASPDFVEFLCSIPDSPLFLMDDLFVTISLAAFSALGEFASKVAVNFVPRMTLRASEPKRLWDDVVRTYSRKRKGQRENSVLSLTAKRRLISISECDDDIQIRIPLANMIQCDSSKAQVNIANNVNQNMNLVTGDVSTQEYDSSILNQERLITCLLVNSNIDFPSNALVKVGPVKDDNESLTNIIVHGDLLQSVRIKEFQYRFLSKDIDLNCPKASVLECAQEPGHLKTTRENSIMNKETQSDESQFRNRMGSIATTCPETYIQYNTSPDEAGIDVCCVSEAAKHRTVKDKAESSCKEGWNLINFDISRGVPEDCNPIDNPTQMLEPLKNVSGSINFKNCNKMTTSLGREKTTAKVESQAAFPSAEPSTAKKQPKQWDSSTLGPWVPSETVYNKNITSPKQKERSKRDQKCISIKEKLKQKKHTILVKESRADSTSIAPKNQLETKALPNFESYIIEEEEGSGGYGTVYRARRKTDGKTFAIKCPHPNAHTHHVNNELKMLERLGGRNFVIKYEGSFTSRNSECFVLEHVVHDRPEVLKREIDIFQLQWYGYCMFRALASLHKQGIVHRDVKPGNFLFSRNLNKGYLIDFNLAMDLNQKYGATSKSKNVPLPSTKSAPPIKGRKVMGSRFLESICRDTVKYSKPSVEPKNMKKRGDVNQKGHHDLGGRSIFKSQGADGSGITSTKDATSTRTPSAERLREPLPCHGRKELISLVHEAMQNADHMAVSIPASQRKRIAAAPGKVDRKLIYPTPMPLHATCIAGAGLLKNKGDGKQKREGPCVGTKGFRAPEVLFRSPHQGPKVDIWSAGVTVLYLMVGRTPFVGDPEQNIKDIAKLRGSEDMWEVAKLHNRESSFPVELFDTQYLPSMELQHWCKMNTKRPDFLELIPDSLFDLVDKCLTVNPRLRISAEEALKHEFFVTCHESLRKQRLHRQGFSLDSGTAHLSHG